MSKPKNREEIHYENLFDRNVNFNERIIYLTYDVDEYSLELVQKAMDEFDQKPDKPIRIEISSYGGSVYDMLGIVDRIKASPCHIVTRGLGKVMSAATFILAAGDKRILSKHSWLMIHQLSTWIAGKSSDLANEMKHIKQLEDQACELYEDLSGGKTKASTFKKLQKRDNYMNAEEVLELGLIDEIV